MSFGWETYILQRVDIDRFQCQKRVFLLLLLRALKHPWESWKKYLAKYAPCYYSEVDKIAEAVGIVHVELILIHPMRQRHVGRMEFPAYTS